MKYLFTYLVLIQSTLFSIESIYGKISNILNPTEEDYRILQHYLLEAERPYLDWLNIFIRDPGDGHRYDVRVRNLRLIKDNEKPVLETVYCNTSPDDRDTCIISYASFNDWYPDGVKRLSSKLQEVGFHGHYIYRIGGWPDIAGGSLQLAHVPYSFKICMFKEALSYGYKKILWLDASIIPLQDLSSLFEIIEKEGYLIASDSNVFSNYINEKVLNYFNLTFDDSKNVEAIAAGIVGFDFTNKNAIEIFDAWSTVAFELHGFLSPRCDQTGLAAVLYQLKLPPTCKLTNICTWERDRIKPCHSLFIEYNRNL